MSAEDEEKQEEAPEEGKKSYWGVTLALLFVFLAGSGYMFLTSTRETAHKLSGNGAVGQYSADAGPGGPEAAARNNNVFASDGQETAAGRGAAVPSAAGSALNDKLKPGWVKEMAEASAAGAAQSAAAQEAARQAEERTGAAAARPSAPATGLTMAAKLQARSSAGGMRGSAGSMTAASGDVEAFIGSGSATGKPSVQRQTAAAAPAKGGRTSVLDALKGSFRASLYGARVASQDSAKSWIAKSFDASPDYDTALQYDDDMRSKLDKVNPDAIPHFLREQDVSAAEAKTLQASDVGKPHIDKEAEEEIKKDSPASKATSSLASSMLNMLFAGMGDSSGGSSAAAATDTTAGDTRAVTAADPNSDPTLQGVNSGTGDDYTDGVTPIYDDATGKLLGCEGGNMCLMAGAPGCP